MRIGSKNGATPRAATVSLHTIVVSLGRMNHLFLLALGAVTAAAILTALDLLAPYRLDRSIVLIVGGILALFVIGLLVGLWVTGMAYLG